MASYGFENPTPIHIFASIRYLKNKEQNMNLDEINTMKEEELNEAKQNWTLDDWITYYTKDGVMTLDEFRDYTIELVLRKLREKHGSDNQ